ncbi:MAG: hypothetical protein ACOY5V_10835 [Pseudomonadota bacterium]
MAIELPLFIRGLAPSVVIAAPPLAPACLRFEDRVKPAFIVALLRPVARRRPR